MMQAVGSGHEPLFPAPVQKMLSASYAELQKAGVVAEASPAVAAGEDYMSDDEEYVYVSRLAEQIAAHAMLDEEEDEDDQMACAEGATCASSYTKEAKFQGCDGFSVSHFAATWRDNGPSEWDCFYTPMLQQDAKQWTSLRGVQAQHSLMFRSWGSLSFGENKKTGSDACEPCDLPTHWKSQLPSNILLPKAKESIGTGVFLPKIVKAGSHYRRKVGLHTKSAYAPRSKF